jgi:4-hydroxy-3-methylbut-2-enyl diphosphate reductase IspH
MRARYGDEALTDHFQAFDTICSATQDRQDAVGRLLDEQELDLMIVIGGYNSSNTKNHMKNNSANNKNHNHVNMKSSTKNQTTRRIP